MHHDINNNIFTKEQNVSKNSFDLCIVSAEEEIFSGKVCKVYATGINGELEILYSHAPLLTNLSPGPVWITKDNGAEEGVVILGGFLEVQPKSVIILADAAIKAQDINEIMATQKTVDLKNQLSSKKQINYAKVHSELASAMAQLRLMKKFRDTRRK